MFHVALYEPEISPNTGDIIRLSFSIPLKRNRNKPEWRTRKRSNPLVDR
jgi:tRNA(Leu) C34 or U34 (ribose-2'-O)-methylase TrmL